MKHYLLILFLLLSFTSAAEDKIIRIYQDADLLNHLESAMAIQQGIEVAFSEINNQIAGYKVEFKYLDHRGNVVRSKQNYEQFLSDSNALAIFSGIHSPPLIKNRSFINEQKALTLVPWAAGGPITRHPASENWVFRLSIDDTRAGKTIIDYAIQQKQCRRPHLLLESSPWGDSNLTNMTKALEAHGMNSNKVTRFSWNTTDQGARFVIREIADNNTDCIILVANAYEGAIFAQAMLDTEANKHIKLISHWGITGGNFHEVISAEKRQALDLSFIQTCFAFTNTKQPDLAKQVFKQLVQHSNGTIKTPKDLKSAVGFIHAYDLTKLLIAAIQQSGLTGEINNDRNIVRLALENLQTPVNGLIKHYQQPFSIFNAENNINAHEALDNSDYCMAKYSKSNEILILDYNNHE